MANNTSSAVAVDSQGLIVGVRESSVSERAETLGSLHVEAAEASSSSSVLQVTKPSSFQRHNSLPASRVFRQPRAAGSVRVKSTLIPKRSNSVINGGEDIGKTWEASQQSLATFSSNRHTSLTSLTSAGSGTSSTFSRSSVFWSASLLYHTGIPTSVSRHLSCQLPPESSSSSSRMDRRSSSSNGGGGSFRREVPQAPRKKTTRSNSSAAELGTEATTTSAAAPKKRGLVNFINRKGSLKKQDRIPTPPTAELAEVSTEQEDNTRCFGSGSSTPEPAPPSRSKLRDSLRIKFRSKQQQQPEEPVDSETKKKTSISTSKIPRASSSSDVSSYGRRTPEGASMTATAPDSNLPLKKSPKRSLGKLFKRKTSSSSSNNKLEVVLAMAADQVHVPEDELPKQLKAKEEAFRNIPDIVTFESEPKVLQPTERPAVKQQSIKYKSSKEFINKEATYEVTTTTTSTAAVIMADANEEAGVVAETLKRVYKMPDEEGREEGLDHDEGVEEGVRETDLDNGELIGNKSGKVEDVLGATNHSGDHYVPHSNLVVPMLGGVGLLGPQSVVEQSVSELESGIGITPSSSLEDQLGKLGAEEQQEEEEEEHVEEVGDEAGGDAGHRNGNVLEKSSTTTSTTESSSGGVHDEAKVHQRADADVEASETESDDEESTASSTESDLSTSLNLSKSLGLTEDETSYTESFKQLKPFQFEHHEPAPEGKRERLYKVLVVGELGTGKTSIIKRYVHQFFSQHYRATIGVDFALKVLRWDPETVVRLQLWDIAGQERFGSMTRVYYKEAVGAFVVFDVTRAATLEAVPKWKADLDAKVVLPDGRPIPTVLIANKCDQPKEGIAANREKMNEFCQQQGFAAWFETSAKDNINIEDSANFLVSQILELDKWSQEPMSSDPDKLDLGANGKVKAGSSSNCAC